MKPQQFVPTQVPVGTLKTLARRLRKQLAPQAVTLSQCQEVMARAFGHGSWHAATQSSPKSNPHEVVKAPASRQWIYRRLEECTQARVSTLHAMEWMVTCAARGQRRDLEAVLETLRAHLEQGESFAQAWTFVLAGQAPMEAFLIAQAEPVDRLAAGLAAAQKILAGETP